MANAPKASKTAARIFLVEDNPGDVYLIEKALQKHQIVYELTCHVDGEAALQALSNDNDPVPDLIVLDLKLPRLQGFDVLRDVQTRPRLSDVPLCVLTSSDAESDRHRVDLIGKVRYIHKPPTLEAFLDQVGGAIEDMLSRTSAG